MFEKIFIANRGEIAVRVIRACRQMGISSALAVAEVDRDTLGARLADEVVVLRGAGGRQAYLDIARLVAAARQTGAQAVHPGYGFLSENADFSQACQEAGLVFIGPSPEAIRSLGDKVSARKIMGQAGVPIVPGTPDPVEDEATALEEAERIGYPVLIKAAGGGGGRGMRLAREAAELKRVLPQARSEAQAAFGNGSLFLERYFERPRHIEVQILADRHGHCVHLWERECSVQRRFQKMLEEAPSPFLTPEVRQKMGEAAVRGTLSAGYSGAGTFEFLVDEERNFYFLEVNTRLQVEHPVTEMITGVDLVREQIRIASGLSLQLTQEDIRPRGWAIECRINCENPFESFRPEPGRVEAVQLPGGPGVRVDTHLYPGYTIPGDFDSLVAKLIVWAEDREEACRRTLAALSELEVGGVHTTIPFHRWLLSHPDFRSGNLSTRFLEEHRFELPVTDEQRRLAALLAAFELHRAHGPRREELVRAGEREAEAWRLAGRREALR